jgi:hypothetical protein
MIAGLRLCNLRQNLEFTKYRPSIALNRSNPPIHKARQTRREELTGE